MVFKTEARNLQFLNETYLSGFDLLFQPKADILWNSLTIKSLLSGLWMVVNPFWRLKQVLQIEE